MICFELQEQGLCGGHIGGVDSEGEEIRDSSIGRRCQGTS